MRFTNAPYQGAPYKSLIVCCLELATNEQAHIGPGDKIWFGRGFIPVDKSNVYKGDLPREAPTPAEVISLATLLSGKAGRDKIAGRVVIIGWDSARTPTINTEGGKTRIHRLFIQCLESCYRTLNASSSNR